MNRDDIVRQAVDILDRYGLADLSMRRLAADLGVQPSALYWHVPNKQTLLAAVADEVLRGIAKPDPTSDSPDAAQAAARALRSTLLAHRDGAELVATAHALGLGEVAPDAVLVEALGDNESARTLLYFILGFVQAEQLREHAASHGAVSLANWAESFDAGVAVILRGSYQDSTSGRPSS